MNYNFLVHGGLPGMLLITAFGAGAILWAAYLFLKIANKKDVVKKQVNTVLYLGSTAFFSSLLFNALGLYEILDYIQQNGEVTYTALAAGLKAASVSVIWGATLFLASYICWFILRLVKDK